jgi:predicted GIY-YIG superfamily endonuclease
MEESATKSEAMRREYQIKQLSRSQKAMLIATFNSNKGLQ